MRPFLGVISGGHNVSRSTAHPAYLIRRAMTCLVFDNLSVAMTEDAHSNIATIRAALGQERLQELEDDG